MRTILMGLILLASYAESTAQTTYYPPLTGNQWDTLSPQQLGWCPDSIASLYSMLDSTKSKAFLVLKEGKIVLEKYFDGFTEDSVWYWASAAKTMTAFMIGQAQEQGYLNIGDSTSHYLDTGWTSLSPQQEGKITIRHQLTMTTGLNDLIFDCTLPGCLLYKSDPGTRWAYHNAPYTLLKDVLENATGQTENQWFYNQVTAKSGISGLWIQSGFNNLLFSKARSMARFGWLILNNGIWGGDTLMHDQTYLQDMITPSQSINESYGYLWWLNGYDSYMLPASQTVFSGMLTPNAPPDMVAGAGKNGQFICAIPGERMVVVRMGENPDSSNVPVAYLNDIWKKISHLNCITGVDDNIQTATDISVYPVPARQYLQVILPGNGTLNLFDVQGRLVNSWQGITGKNQFEVSNLRSALYFMHYKNAAAVIPVLIQH